MILFVFEGAEREPKRYKTLERLFFGAGEKIAILNGFPLFLFDYFKIGFWQ